MQVLLSLLVPAGPKGVLAFLNLPSLTERSHAHIHVLAETYAYSDIKDVKSAAFLPGKHIGKAWLRVAAAAWLFGTSRCVSDSVAHLSVLNSRTTPLLAEKGSARRHSPSFYSSYWSNLRVHSMHVCFSCLPSCVWVFMC